MCTRSYGTTIHKTVISVISNCFYLVHVCALFQVYLYLFTKSSSLCFFFLICSCQIPYFSDFKFFYIAFLGICPVQSNITFVYTFDLLSFSVLYTLTCFSTDIRKVLKSLTHNCMNMTNFLSVYCYVFCVYLFIYNLHSMDH